jgi:hypothetical protein
MNDDIGTTTACLLLVLHSGLRREIQVTLKNSFVTLRYVNRKVNMKLPLCLIKHRAMKAYEGGDIAPRDLNLGIS